MRKTKLIVFLILPSSFILSALAGSATWNLNPTSTQWINPANWTPAVVPNGPLDTATFDISGKTAVSLTATTTELDSIIFNPSASAFTITLVPDVDSNPALIVSGAGVSNQSGFEQNLVAGTSGFQVSTINFINSASAGTDVTYTLASNRAPGAAQSNLIQFFDDSTAESATFVIEPPHRQGAAGQMSFGGNATAASATFFNSLGFLGFYGNATAADAVINDDTCFLTFSENSTAGNAVVNQRNANITFSGAATAGNGTFTLHDSGVFFGGDGGNALFTLKASSAQFSSGTAGNAIFVLDGGMASAMVGSVAFFNFASSGGNATFNLEGGQVSDAPGAIISFFGQRGYTGPSAADSVITLNSGQVSEAQGGMALFSGFADGPNNATAGNASIIAKGGLNDAGGGSIIIQNTALGGTARIEVFGNGNLDVSNRSSDVTIGSLAGDGLVFLGSTDLNLGVNNLETVFSGTLQDTGGIGTGTHGSLTKLGTAKLTLSGASIYTGGTTVNAGTLAVTNTNDSATGVGAVKVNAGTLGGSGIISGAVTLGTGSGGGAFLAPAVGAIQKSTLTLQSSLTIQSDATYTYTFKAKGSQAKADKVIANGMTINGGNIDLQGTIQGTLQTGLILTLIDNTAATPISGAFANLADGAIVNVNGNNLQASYSGGDGNDLTLTVVP